MHIQLITASDFVFYLIKYAMKVRSYLGPGTPGTAHLRCSFVHVRARPAAFLLACCRQAEPSGLLNLDDHARVVLGIPEVAAEALSQPFIASTARSCLSGEQCTYRLQVSMSQSVTYIPSDPVECRKRTVHGTNFLATALDLYGLRPLACIHLAYKPFFREYIVLRADRAPPRSSTLVGQTVDGSCRVYAPAKPRIVRFSDPNPATKPEAYFYDLLLEHVPFRDESELLSASNKSRTYFEECKLRGIVSCLEDLHHHIDT
jgi:hypothetical protein